MQFSIGCFITFRFAILIGPIVHIVPVLRFQFPLLT